MEKTRLSDGWQIPDMGTARLIVSPNEKDIEQLVQDNDIHICSGINAYPMVYSAFRQAIARNKKIIIYAEPYDQRGFKGILRRMMYRYLAIRYGKHITALLATGENGVSCFRKAGFTSEKVFEWAYFTEQHPSFFSNNKNKTVRFLFIGQLIERKAILPLIDVFQHISKQFDCTLTIIGDGALREEVIKNIQEINNIYYLGTQPNEKIHMYLSRADLLILPSYHDGWGAVVNEALQAGCRVLCSTVCGAASLLDGKKRGGTFNWQIKGDLQKQLIFWCQKGTLSPSERAAIQKWSQQAISGEAATKYLEQILDYTNTKQNPPVAPWHTQA